MRTMSVALTVLVVTKKSRAISSLPGSAVEQVGGSREGAEPGRQPKLANRNIPYHGQHAQLMNGGWPGGQELSFPGVSTIFCLFLGV